MSLVLPWFWYKVRVRTQSMRKTLIAELLRNFYLYEGLHIYVRLITSTSLHPFFIPSCAGFNTHTLFMYVRFNSSYQCGKYSARRCFVVGGRWKVVHGCRNGFEAHTDKYTCPFNIYYGITVYVPRDKRIPHVSAVECRGGRGVEIHNRAPTYIQYGISIAQRQPYLYVL